MKTARPAWHFMRLESTQHLLKFETITSIITRSLNLSPPSPGREARSWATWQLAQIG